MSDNANHFLVTTTARKTSYRSLGEATTALRGLIALQMGRGYETERNANGRHISKHPVNPAVVFWVENQGGVIVS
jgi:hypothetical protein